MTFTKLVCAAIVAGAFGTSAVQAQSLRQAQVPAELPPASYKANQYVDSRGCVFIRAGVDGSTTWVPRVSRERKPLCGMQPTVIANAGGAATSSPARGVEVITLDTPVETAAAAPAPKPAPAPAPAARRAPAPAPAAAPVVRRAPAPAAPAPRVARRAPTPTVAPAPVAQAARPAPAPASAPAAAAPARVVVAPVAAPTETVASNPACQGASPVSSQYINASRNGLSVRCGPQQVAAHNGGTGATGQGVTVTSEPGSGITANTRVLPRHVAQERANTPAFSVPKGYRAAWEDERLNPRRAEGTLGGWGQMKLIWTDTVPRRLIDQTTGRDLTGEVALVYPFTDVATQQRELGQVTFATRDGQKVKRILRNPGAPSVAELAKRPAPVVATRSAPEPAAAPAPRAKPVAKPAAKAKPSGESIRGKRYVQIGSYNVPQNAQATAAKLKRTGLPVRIGKLTRNGKTVRLVLAGPFADDASAKRALRAAQRAGFKDAYLRK